MLFDGLPAELPTATLLSDARHARHRMIGGHLRHWLDDRWSWLRPRTVPMIVAFVGMLAVLGSTTYLSTYAGTAPRRSFTISGPGDDPATQQRRDCLGRATARDRNSPGHIHIVPTRPGSQSVTITLEP